MTEKTKDRIVEFRNWFDSIVLSILLIITGWLAKNSYHQNAEISVGKSQIIELNDDVKKNTTDIEDLKKCSEEVKSNSATKEWVMQNFQQKRK